MGMAADIRQVGEILIIPAAVFALLAGRGWWRRAAYLVVGGLSCAIPMLVYMTISQASGNGFALAAQQQNVYYGRAAVAANCSTLKLPAYEESLCPTPKFAALGIDQIINDANGPLQSYKPPPGQTASSVIHNFEVQVAEQQPLAIPLSTLRDAVRLFALTRDLPAGGHAAVRGHAGPALRRGWPEDDQAAGHVPAGLPAVRRLHPGAAAGRDDGGGCGGLLVRVRPAAKEPAALQPIQ
jgi:hypothetical protein